MQVRRMQAMPVAAAAVCLLCSPSARSAARPATTQSGGVSKPQPVGDELARLRAAYRARPNDPAAALALGVALYRKDRTSLEAERLLDVAARRFPERHDVQLMLLDSYLARENAAAVRALIERIQPALDASTRFAFDVAYNLIKGRQFELAQAQWQRVSQRVQAKGAGTEAAEAVFIQGLLAAAAGNKEEALKLLRRADGQGFPPLDSPQLLMLADTFYWLAEYNLAAATYTEALRHFPDNVPARLQLGVALYWSAKHGEARRELEEALRRNPRLPEANYFIGAALSSLKQFDQAKPYFEKELALNPRCDRCLSALAYVAYVDGDDQAARERLEQAVALHSTEPEIDLVYGMLANRAGKYDEAIQHLSKVVEQYPRYTQAHFQLATAYQRHGDVAKAQEHVRIYRELVAAEEAQAAATGQ